MDGKTAYVTDPATKKLIAVSLSNPAAPKELMSVELPKTPNEILGVSSSNTAPVEAESHGTEAHGSASSSASADAHESGESHSH
ncbi:beta-propeller domain-containing protein [Rothia sp. HMSC068F09]|uniref:beta-propeller domain-containing protein n=1 Tax=Rothia sp. HMSC068F09 TaxID=1739378 RepID=UPI001FEF8E39|nr:beta-propeller domain-containing protein [Rothia sp. HMSC068F09]